ncbi:hypothetical protein PYCCODRAFT_807244 [Trametes coccinea BRFM310]|uniref:Uncharacterized protein n=1 Tax=Trametes coccinea (strain BRFM310) TaxID=1353009 RepID=A0A1Y2IEL3_TRAC3|nr:hypothetical protein PYCCODRAFT_807244 [Trametes coccinea BRFM310]
MVRTRCCFAGTGRDRRRFVRRSREARRRIARRWQWASILSRVHNWFHRGYAQLGLLNERTPVWRPCADPRRQRRNAQVTEAWLLQCIQRLTVLWALQAVLRAFAGSMSASRSPHKYTCPLELCWPDRYLLTPATRSCLSRRLLLPSGKTSRAKERSISTPP